VSVAIQGRDAAVSAGDGPGRFAGWLEAGADPSRASIARVYDYWLGGDHNLVVDRELGERMATLDPRIPAACRANRAFLRRAVRFLAGQGIRQFIDLGSGIPTAGNVHQIAREAGSSSRVVYVDRDPVAVAEGRKILQGHGNAAVIQADVREPERILAAPETARLIDFSEPVGLLFVAILHFVLDADDPHGIVAQFRDAVVPGSYLVISHVVGDAAPKLTAAVQDAYNSRGADGQARSREEIARFFTGWAPVEPGLAYAPAWRPDSPGDVPASPDRFWFLAGAAIRQAPAVPEG
jgi:SAM-dependent methyltransferase